MSQSAGATRPRQLTMASWFVIVGSAFLLLTVFDTLAGLNSVETRDRVAEVLSSPTGEGLGIGIDDALGVMRVALSIAAVCAAVAVVLGAFVLQRHNGARIALTVVAVPILLTSPLTGLVGAFVAAAVGMLWTGQGRDWFAGRPVREATPLFAPRQRRDEDNRPPQEPPPPTPTRPEPDPERPETPPTADVSTGNTSDEPGETHGFGTAPGSHSSGSQHAPAAHRRDIWSAYPDPGPESGAQAGPEAGRNGTGGRQFLPVPPSYGGPAGPRPRGPVPAPVKLACVLTWIFSGIVALTYLGAMAVLLFSPETVTDPIVESEAWREAAIDRDLLVPVLWVGSLMFLGWAVGAMVLAWFTWRRHEWARWVLVASAACALLAGIVAFPAGVAHQLAAAATMWALLSAPARDWFSDGRRQGPPGPHPPGRHQQGSHQQGPPPAKYQDRPGPW